MMPFSAVLMFVVYIALIVLIVWQVISALNRMATAFEDIAYTFRQYTNRSTQSNAPQSS